jgi:DNA-directed RNA polymerase subunit RPC12/RpoP
MPKQTIMSTISDQKFIEIVKNSESLKEIAIKCGYSNFSGASSNIVKKRIENLNISIEHFKRSMPIIRTDDEIFIEDSPVDQSTLRRRYIIGNFTEYKCSICGQEPFWNNKELTLTLDHINGHNRDNRIINLRWVCPNCDRQLDTFAGKNITTEIKKNYCIDCGIEICQSSTRCNICSAKFNGGKRRIQRPSREELKDMIRTKSFVQIGKDFNISDNAIRKWCDEYLLPRTKKEIQKYSEKEWQLL